jgi:hypothetical protein
MVNCWSRNVRGIVVGYETTVANYKMSIAPVNPLSQIS